MFGSGSSKAGEKRKGGKKEGKEGGSLETDVNIIPEKKEREGGAFSSGKEGKKATGEEEMKGINRRHHVTISPAPFRGVCKGRRGEYSPPSSFPCFLFLLTQ